MSHTWNLVKEIRKRENRHANDLSEMKTIDFNRNGNLLLGTNRDELCIWDWNREKIMANHKLGLPSRNEITDGKFLNTVGSVETIVATDCNYLFHVPILSSGPIISTQFEFSELKHFTVNPQACNEIITVGWISQDIHIKDICTVRDANNTCINTHSEYQFHLSHVAHHPFAPEISVCGHDAYTHVYDKRNMRQAIHKIGPRLRYLCPTTAFSTYNYAGNEIKTQYSPEYISIYENKANGKNLYSFIGYSEVYTATFMGPHSEYIVTTITDRAYFWDKKSETRIVTLSSRKYIGKNMNTSTNANCCKHWQKEEDCNYWW